MVRVPDWAFEAAGQEMRMGQDAAAYQPGLYLTAAQVMSWVERLGNDFILIYCCIF